MMIKIAVKICLFKNETNNCGANELSRNLDCAHAKIALFMICISHRSHLNGGDKMVCDKENMQTEAIQNS